MKVVLGLGNPGPRYDATRHNVGWWVVDRIAHDWNAGPFRKEGPALVAEGAFAGQAVRLTKPVTYVNRSGAALTAPELAVLDPTRDLLVVVDDAALDVGRVRFRPGGSAGGHNGLKDVERALGSQEYPRLRIGIGPDDPRRRGDLSNFVLGRFGSDERSIVLDLMPKFQDAIEIWLRDGIVKAMNAHNGDAKRT